MNSNEIVHYTGTLDDIQRVSRLLAMSGYFDIKGSVEAQIAQVATKILAGAELGFGPFAAVNGIHIIQGRPSVGANLMASAVKGSGRYDYRVREMSDKACRIEFFERTNGKLEPLGISEFTAEDARKAGTKNMDKFPRNMLFARAMSNGVRFYCPDVFSGNTVYVPEELGANVDGDGNVIDGNFRTVDAATGEITSNPAAPAPSAPPSPTTQATSNVYGEADGDVIFDRNTAWYAAARNNLPAAHRLLADNALILHRNNGGPASVKAYGYLCGLLDQIVEQAMGVKDAHKRVLAVLCQMDVTGDNRPSATMTGHLLSKIATHRMIDGVKQVNSDYGQDTADAMVTIYRAAEAVGTPSLLPA